MNSKKKFIFVQDDERHAEIMKKDLQRTDSDLYHFYCAMEGDSAEAAAVRKMNENHLVSEMNNAWANYEKSKAKWGATRGVTTANKNRHQSAADYWEPHQDEFNRLCSEGMKPGKARHEIRNKITAEKTWPPPYAANMKDIQQSPSEAVLKRWLK